MGGGAQEDMFAKLDAMREIITEVNTQFKDPVRNEANPADNAGEDNLRLCLHLRVPVALRD
jgi:hypothetical protein